MKIFLSKTLQDRKTFQFREDLIPENFKKKSSEANQTFGDSPEDVGHEIRFRIHQVIRLVVRLSKICTLKYGVVS